MSSTYFIGIDQPAVLRRDLLDSAKISVTVLKSQYRLREIRAEKIRQLARLREISSELVDVTHKLSGALPQHSPENIPEVAKKAIARALEEERKQLAAQEEERRILEEEASKNAREEQESQQKEGAMASRKASRSRKPAQSVEEASESISTPQPEQELPQSPGPDIDDVVDSEDVMAQDTEEVSEEADDGAAEGYDRKSLDDLNALEAKLTSLEEKLNKL